MENSRMDVSMDEQSNQYGQLILKNHFLQIYWNNSVKPFFS